MRDFISFKQSQEIIQNIEVKQTTQKKFISQALGYVLAKDIVADHNSPEFPTSGMDGYAIKHEDLKIGKIKIIDKNPAGSVI